MSDLNDALGKLQDFAKAGYWGERIASELRYCYQLSQLNDGIYNETMRSVIEYVAGKQLETGCICEATVSEAERQLSSIGQVAKAYEVVCAAHAHIDMNWQWGWDETVSVTLDTFRTMLDLMEEYPEFTFSQSQASVYEIVAKHDPDMLQEIKRRVHEGRWEVTASAWVEADKNMPNGESMARHILYTRRYLAKLLDIDPESLNLTFEPDTFGHNVNVPEVLANGGVRYYYHCRGAEGDYLERWTAPSGRSIIVYREPFWYNADITPALAFSIPELCERYGLKKFIKVYGVGDHGGGPTRKDIEKILDMNTWPLFPRIRFGTFAEFFAAVDKVKDNLPVTEGEKNFIFTGCYTSQSRIKLANRMGEAALNEAETFAGIANAVIGAPYSNEAFAQAWQNVLFNQFHDIIPGSCVIASREHAMGLFQETMAIAGSAKKRALAAYAKQIDTSGILADEDIADTRSEGAGAGFGVQSFQISQASRGAGKTRLFHVFNPAPYERNEVTEVVVWDWDYDLERVMWTDAHGKAVAHQVLESGRYWGHTYTKMLIAASAPACGYSTYVMTQRQSVEPKISFPRDPRVETQPQLVLENELIKAVFDQQNCTLVSLLDKRTGEQLVSAPAALFRMIDEDITRGTAWRVGRYKRVDHVVDDVKLVKLERGELRQTITYEVAARDSKLTVAISLDTDSPRLDFAVECDWQEVGNKEKGVPQLNFHVPLAYECATYKYDVPYGVIAREPMDWDVPANSWAQAIKAEGKSQLMVVTDSKYGFRGVNNSLAVTLIRSSFDPDPYPENGKIHRIRLSLYADATGTNQEAITRAYDSNHPLTVLSSRGRTKGVLPLSQAFLEVVGGSAVVAAVKRPEASSAESELIVRVYEAEGAQSEVSLAFAQHVVQACFVDINEKPLANDGIRITENQVLFPIRPYGTATLKIQLEPIQA